MVAVGVSEVKNNRPSHKEDFTVLGSATLVQRRSEVKRTFFLLCICGLCTDLVTLYSYWLQDWTGLD